MSLRLVHLSDTHFGFEDKDAVEAALTMARELAPDLTLVTGDLTLAGRPAEFLAARAWLDRLPRPMLATPGNHDTPYWNLVLRSLSPFDRWRRYIGADERAAFESPGLAAYALNTARGAQLRPNWALGAISPAAVDDIATRFAAIAGALRVFACHHPLIDVEGAPVSGGVHGGGHSYIAGAGTLSRRTRGAPASFSVIEAAADAVTVTAQAWTGSHFEPFRTWALPRRSGGG